MRKSMKPADIFPPYRAKLPNGEIVEVDRISYNLAYAAMTGGAKPGYIQCSDTGWARVDRLALLPSE